MLKWMTVQFLRGEERSRLMLTIMFLDRDLEDLTPCLLLARNSRKPGKDMADNGLELNSVRF
jgi:hypothetical protein